MTTVELKPRREQATWTTPAGEVKPLFEADGKTPVPLVPDQWAIHVDGHHVGYCGRKPSMPIGLTVHLPEVLVRMIENHVRERVGGFKGDKANMVGPPIEVDDDVDTDTE